jgi:NADPH:quinone reductase
MQAQRIVFKQPGGPDVLEIETVEPEAPQANEVRIEQKAIGVNYIDIYHRNGLYPLPCPSGLGMEAAGVVVDVGSKVTEFKAGDRIAYAGASPGAYATCRTLPAGPLVKLPDAIGFDAAAALMLRGLTAQYLLRRTYRVSQGEPILVHAAAGGVGLLLCQWAKALGATVIGTVGSPEKAALAQANGCDHVILYREENILSRVRAITGHEGVAVVYDSIGKDTFMDSLSCLRPMGYMVLFGAASGPVPPFDPQKLGTLGALFLTRPSLFTYTARRRDLLSMADELFEVVLSGKLKVHIGQRYALADVALAHAALEGRQTTGSTVLFPNGCA